MYLAAIADAQPPAPGPPPPPTSTPSQVSSKIVISNLVGFYGLLSCT